MGCKELWWLQMGGVEVEEDIPRPKSELCHLASQCMAAVRPPQWIFSSRQRRFSRYEANERLLSLWASDGREKEVFVDVV